MAVEVPILIGKPPAPEIATIPGLSAQLASKADLVAGVIKDDQIPDTLATKNGEGVNWVTVESGADPVENGANLLAAYNAAKSLMPNGAAISATNRAWVLVPPGRYDLGTTPLVLDTNYVDVIGVSPVKESVQVVGSIPHGSSSAVIVAATLHYILANLTIRNLADLSVGGSYDSTDGAVFRPNPSVSVFNFLSGSGAFHKNIGVLGNDSCFTPTLECGGLWEDCEGGNYSFGGEGSVVSGTFRRCRGGNGSFGRSGAVVSGVFEDCVGGGDCFGSYDGTASGTFIRCVAETDSFGGVASGVFRNCVGGGYSFGAGGTASGTFIDCIGGDNSFGGGGGLVSGTLERCTAGPGGFGGDLGTLTGRLRWCRLDGSGYPSTVGGGHIRMCIDQFGDEVNAGGA